MRYGIRTREAAVPIRGSRSMAGWVLPAAHVTRVVFAFAVMLCLSVSLLPSFFGGSQALAANRKPVVVLGTAVLDGAQDSTIYFASYDVSDDDIDDPSPIPWTVLDANNDSDTSSPGNQQALFVLSKAVFDSNSYFYDEDNAPWDQSSLKRHLESFCSEYLNPSEQRSLASTVKTEIRPAGQLFERVTLCNLTGERFFAPSQLDLMLPSYGFREPYYSFNEDRRMPSIEDLVAGTQEPHAASYWTRSPILFVAGYEEVGNAPTILEGGDILNTNFSSGIKCGLRPACNIATSQVLFTSQAVDGKSTDLIDGSVTAPWPTLAISQSEDWKLTLLDDDAQKLIISDVSRSGDTLTISYKDATCGPAQYLSGMIVSSDGSELISYGTLASLSDTTKQSGTVSVTLPEDFDDSNYQLKVFSEQCRGDYLSDVASSPICVTPSSANSLLSFSLNGQIGETCIDDAAATVDLALPASTDLTALSAVFTLSDKASASIESLPVQSGIGTYDFSDDVAFVVTAEDGSSKTWTLRVSAGGSSENNITSFELNGQAASIDASARSISLELPFGSDVMTAIPELQLSAGAHVVQPFEPCVDFSQPVEYVIQAEDGTSASWTVTVQVTAPLTGATITAFELEGASSIDIDSANHSIVATYPYGTNPSTFSSLVPSISLSPEATVLPRSGNAQDFTNPVTYIVTAQDRATQETWTVTARVAPNTEKDMLTFSVRGQIGESVIDAENHSITLSVADTVNLTSIVPTFTVSPDASAAPKSGRMVNCVNPVTYTVTAQDGSTQEWVLTVLGGYYPVEADLQSFSIGVVAGAIDASAHTVTVHVSTATDLSALTPTFTASRGARAFVSGVEQQSGVSVQDFSNPVVYEIVSSDEQLHESYTVSVLADASSAKDITSFSIGDAAATINQGDNTISCSLPYGTAVDALQPVFTASENASVSVNGAAQESGSSVQDFTNPVVYTVAAQDGSTRNYTVSIVLEKNSSAAIESFSVLGVDGIIDNNEHTVFVKLPLGIAENSIRAVAPSIVISEGATISPAAGAVQNFTQPLSYTVSAEDGSSVTWTVSVEIAQTTWERLCGETAYDTANAIVTKGFDASSCDTVVLASGGGFQDALAASALAGTCDAPILLTEKNTLNMSVRRQIERLGATTVYIVGGEAVVSATVEDEVYLTGDVENVVRLAGRDYTDTANEIAFEVAKSTASEKVIVCFGGNFADALSISPYAYATATPVFLTDRQGTLTEETVQAIKSSGAKDVLIVGGGAAVKETVRIQLGGSFDFARIADTDAYGTSAAIAKWATGADAAATFQPDMLMDFNTCGVATGEQYADGLTGGAFCGKAGGILLLGNDSASGLHNVDVVIADHITAIENGYIFGGTAVVSQDLEARIKELIA